MQDPYLTERNISSARFGAVLAAVIAAGSFGVCLLFVFIHARLSDIIFWVVMTSLFLLWMAVQLLWGRSQSRELSRLRVEEIERPLELEVRRRAQQELDRLGIDIDLN